MNWNRLLGMCVVAAALTACGGGGGQAGTTPFGSNGNNDSAATTSATALSIRLGADSVADTDTTGVTATVTATDANGKTVSGANITYKVTGGNYTQSEATTDANGENKITVKLGANKANRTITIVATDGTNSATAYLTVTGAKLSSTATQAILAPSASGSVIFRLKDAANNGLAYQDIEIRTSAGASKTAKTDVNGEYTYDFTAPSTTGTFQVTATVGGVTATQDVLIQTSSTAIADSGTPTQMSLDANPTVVSVNSSGSTANSVTVRALFLGSGNNPLANVRVKFDLNGDTNNIGGTFSIPNVYTDANGYAITSYIPGTRFSPTNGLTIRACWATTGDSAAVVCDSTHQMTKTITVTADAVSVSIGGDDVIGVDEDLVYSRRFVVTVVDGAGVAKPGVTISPTLDLLYYAKGKYTKAVSGGWSIPKKPDTTLDIAVCQNEDLDRNNQIGGSGLASEDINHNGSLDPRKADAAVSFDTGYENHKTDANGHVILKVSYNRSSGSWIKYALNVSGSVNGSEGRFTWMEWAPVPTSALTADGAPAFEFSPYGTYTADDVTLTSPLAMPDGVTLPVNTVFTACMNPN